MRHPSLPRRVAGQSLVEFLIVFPLVILLVFGLIQMALLYQVRATLNHATLLAARAGALHNGDKSSMRDALATGLAPLFATGASVDKYGLAVVEAKKETSAAYGLVTLSVLNPTRAALNDFGRPRIDGMSGRELPADTLNYRNPAPGAASGLSVQDANLLHLRVRYCVRLIVPLMDRVIVAGLNALPGTSGGASGSGMQDPFGTGGTTIPGDCASPFSNGLRIPIQSEAIVRMQSPFFEANL